MTYAGGTNVTTVEGANATDTFTFNDPSSYATVGHNATTGETDVTFTSGQELKILNDTHQNFSFVLNDGVHIFG